MLARLGPDGSLAPDAVALVEPWRGKHLVLVATRDADAARVAEKLLEQHFERVSVLAGGASRRR